MQVKNKIFNDEDTLKLCVSIVFYINMSQGTFKIQLFHV